MSDSQWYAPGYKIPQTSTPVREEVLSFLMVKDSRLMTGSLRPIDDERVEVVDRVNGELYSALTVASRELAEQHLAKNQSALAAVGWTEEKIN
jgi:hypothetical protein